MGCDYPQRHTATRNGRPLHPSVKEFSVLEALLRASPTVLSTEDLLEQVWDESADPFTNTVFNTLSRRLLVAVPVGTLPGSGRHLVFSTRGLALVLGQIVLTELIEHPRGVPVHHSSLVMHGRRPIVGSPLPFLMLRMLCLMTWLGSA